MHEREIYKKEGKGEKKLELKYMLDRLSMREREWEKTTCDRDRTISDIVRQKEKEYMMLNEREWERERETEMQKA